MEAELKTMNPTPPERTGRTSPQDMDTEMSTIERLRDMVRDMAKQCIDAPKGKAFFDGTADLIEALQAENAALRKGIESLGWCHGCGEPLSKHCPKCERLQVGTCIYCGLAIWNNDARMTDVGGDFHPICAVNAKVHNLQAANMELVGHVGILLSEIRNAGLNETSHQRAAQFFIKELALKTARP